MKKGNRRFKVVFIFLTFFAVWILIAPFLAERLIVEKPLTRADVIIVLGGSSVYLERTAKAAENYKSGVAPKILLTDDGERAGWSRVEKRNPPYVELARANLIAQDVPPENIEIIKPSGSGTIYEAQITREKARENNWKSVLIVTSAYHTRRAFNTFEKVFADDDVQIGIAASLPGQESPSPNGWWLTAQGWNSVGGEYAKSFYYWMYY